MKKAKQVDKYQFLDIYLLTAIRVDFSRGFKLYTAIFVVALVEE